MVIRRIGVGSAAKVAGALYALMGLIAGVIFAAFGLVTSVLAMAAQSEEAFPAWVGVLFGGGAVIFLPILYGVFGVLIGALTAALYNFVAGFVGGLTLETE